MRAAVLFAVIGLVASQHFDLTLDTFDEDKDGSLVLTEIEELCEGVDTSGDGKIDFNEFAAATEGETVEERRAQFKFYDDFGENDGHIDCTVDTTNLFSLLDANGNGVVTKHEYDVGVAKLNGEVPVGK